MAIILMVAGHVIGSNATRGMNVSDDSVWRLYYLCLEDVRMPLFTVISGYIYAIRPVPPRSDRYTALLQAKVRRLLVPLVTVGTVLFVMQLAIPATNADPEAADFWRTYVFPFEHLWFLQAIFLIFVVVGLLDWSGLLVTAARLQVAVAIAFVVFVIVRLPPELDVFSINGAIRLIPFFLMGYAIRRHGMFEFQGRRLVVVCALAACAFAVKLVVIWEVWVPGSLVARMISLAVGVLSVALVFSLRSRLRSAALAWLGSFSFGIYLLHVFPAAAMRMLLSETPVANDTAVFALCLGAGLLGPVIFQALFDRFWVVRTLILGEKAERRPTRLGAA